MKFLNRNLKIYLVIPLILFAGTSGAILGQYFDAFALASRWAKVNEMYQMLEADVSHLTLATYEATTSPKRLKEAKRVWYQRCEITPQDNDCPSTVVMNRVKEINEQIAQLRTERTQLKEN